MQGFNSYATGKAWMPLVVDGYSAQVKFNLSPFLVDVGYG